MITKDELKLKIKSLIAKDKLKKAIQLLSKHIGDNEDLDALLIQQARYNRIKQQAASGTISKDELNNEINTLGRHILAFIREDDWEVKAVEVENEKLSMEDFQTNLSMSLTRVVVGRLLLQYAQDDEAFSMRMMMKETQLKSRKLVIDFIQELEACELVSRKKEEVVMWKVNKAGRKLLSKVLK